MILTCKWTNGLKVNYDHELSAGADFVSGSLGFDLDHLYKFKFSQGFKTDFTPRIRKKKCCCVSGTVKANWSTHERNHTDTGQAARPAQSRTSSSLSPSVPMAPKVLMVSTHRRRRPAAYRATAPSLMAAAVALLSRPSHARVAVAAGRGEAQHRALHRLRPLRRPRKSPSLPPSRAQTSHGRDIFAPRRLIWLWI